MKTVFCLFRKIDSAQSAIQELVDKKFPGSEINVIIQIQAAKNELRAKSGARNIAVTGSAAENGSASVLGRMVRGRQPITITDVGQVYAAGELAKVLATTSSASAPADIHGGFQAALINFGLPKTMAGKFYDGIKAGGILLILRTADERASEAASMLRSQDGGNLVSHTG